MNHEVLCKALAAEFDNLKKSNDKVRAGTYDLTSVVTIEINGSVTQASDVLATPTCEIPLLAVLARVIEKTGWAGDLVAKYITEAATEAITAGEPGGKYIEYTKASLEKVREAITSKLPKKPKAGSMTRSLDMKIVSVKPKLAKKVG